MAENLALRVDSSLFPTQVWAVVYAPNSVTEDIYQRALLLLDPESQARIRRFYRREDACRTLIGRMLIRVLLKDRGISTDAMQFASTAAGKPYTTSIGIQPPIAYNITHDNAIVAMAFAEGSCNPPAFSIGIDIMKVRVPERETFPGFVETVGDQLSSREHQLLSPSVPVKDALRRFFWMWTMKEAYTKALGMGLGFDFRRVEYDPVENVLLVDGRIPKGWSFIKFEIQDGEDLYQGVVAEDTGSDVELPIIVQTGVEPWNAATFLSTAVSSLT